MGAFRPTNDNYMSSTASTLPAERKKVGEIFVTRNFMEIYVCSSCVAEVGSPDAPDNRFSTNDILDFWRHVQFCSSKIAKRFEQQSCSLIVENSPVTCDDQVQDITCDDQVQEATNEKAQTETNATVVLNWLLNTSPKNKNPYNSNVNNVRIGGDNSLTKDSIINSDNRTFEEEIKRDSDSNFTVLEEESINANGYSSIKKNSAMAEEDLNVGNNLRDLPNEEMVRLNDLLEHYEDDCHQNGWPKESVPLKTYDLLSATEQHALETSLDNTNTSLDNTVIVISDDEQEPDSPISAPLFTPLVPQMDSVSEQTRNNSHNNIFPQHEKQLKQLKKSNLKFSPIQILSCASLTDPKSNQHIPSSDHRGGQCSVCAKKFDFNWQRIFHEKTHTNYTAQAKKQTVSANSRYCERAFKCRECGRRTCTQEGLQKHMKRFHPYIASEHEAKSKPTQKGNGFHCLVCKIFYKQKAAFMKHIERHHNYSELGTTNFTNNGQTHLQPSLHTTPAAQGNNLPHIMYPPTQNDATRITQDQRISEPVVANSTNNPSAPTLPLIYMGPSGHGYHLPHIYPTTQNDAITQNQRFSEPIVANSTNNPSATLYRCVANSSNEPPYYRLSNSPLVRPPSDPTMTTTHYSWHKQSPYQPAVMSDDVVESVGTVNF